MYQQFLPLLQTPVGLQPEVMRLSFSSALEPWAVQSGLGLGSLTHKVSPWFLFTIPECGTAHSSGCHYLATSLSLCPGLATTTLSPLCPNSLSLHLLLVWMNIASLNPWLLDFRTGLDVFLGDFSRSSGCLLFLSKLCSFLWLCNEARHVYLCLHPDWKPLLRADHAFYSQLLLLFNQKHSQFSFFTKSLVRIY